VDQAKTGTRKGSLLLIMCAKIILLVLFLVVLQIFGSCKERKRRSGSSLGFDCLQQWAAANDLMILQSEPRIFLRGPYMFRSSMFQYVYKVKVKTPSRILDGWVRIGPFFNRCDSFCDFIDFLPISPKPPRKADQEN